MSTSDFVIVANRLPVDRVVGEDGSERWQTSPGGLVTALEPVMQAANGAWVGWAGAADQELDPFEADGIHLVPVRLGEEEIELYYEGMSNDTIWPLYHDVISPPRYRRVWWDAYVAVNQRFARAAADVAAPEGTVWVHDYQLQLVPAMLRAIRPDVTIGYFHHIPFPAYGLFAQLPWRRAVLEGLLGADVIGFQRPHDASNFQSAVRRVLKHHMHGVEIDVPTEGSERTVVARSFPISIDVATFLEVAERPEVRARAVEIRRSLGDPATIMLGVDRLDYTKGIRHRLKAYEELLAEGRLSSEDVALITVASPSRERVDAYQHLRDEIELSVGRINGRFDTLSTTAVRYLHHSYPREEMVALYLAADVMLVTSLRDGMNLVAKEYVAVRTDNTGVLVLSEFTGAADELRTAVQVNPHDIEGLKDAMAAAVEMPRGEQSRRMRALRRRVVQHDVRAWSAAFIAELDRVRGGEMP